MYERQDRTSDLDQVASVILEKINNSIFDFHLLDLPAIELM